MSGTSESPDAEPEHVIYVVLMRSGLQFVFETRDRALSWCSENAEEKPRLFTYQLAAELALS